MTTITQSISAITPSDPRTMARDEFSAAAPQTIVDITDMVTELNTWAGQVNTVAGELNANAAAAAASEAAAAASAASASAAANVTEWVSGTIYAAGDDTVWSPIDFLTYRRKTDGGGVTDPSADSTNWQLLLAVGDPQWSIVTADPAPAVAGSSYQCNTSGGAFTVTLPAAPSANDLVRIADYAGTFATNNLTVGRNALNIMGLAEDMVIGTNNISITLTYIDATQGWRIS